MTATSGLARTDSMYRYFPGPAALGDAAIERHREKSASLAHLPSIGRGPLARRIDDFALMRLRLHAGIGAAHRAGDVLTQLDSIEVLRNHRGLSVTDTTQALRVSLQRLLEGSR